VIIDVVRTLNVIVSTNHGMVKFTVVPWKKSPPGMPLWMGAAMLMDVDAKKRRAGNATVQILVLLQKT